MTDPFWQQAQRAASHWLTKRSRFRGLIIRRPVAIPQPIKSSIGALWAVEQTAVFLLISSAVLLPIAAQTPPFRPVLTDPSALTTAPLPAGTPQQFIEELASQRRALQGQSLRAIAKGRLTGWVQTAGEPQPARSLNAEIVIVVDQSRYCIQMLHAASSEVAADSKQHLEVILYDGQTIYTLSAKSGGSRGGIFFEFSQSAVLRSAGFPFTTVFNYWDDALNLKEIDPRAVNQTQLERGGLMLLEDRQTYLRQMHFNMEMPFGLQRVALRHPNATAAFREHWLTWDHIGDSWYVRNYVVRHRYATREPPPGQIVARQFEIDLDRFEPHAQLDADVLSLTGLGIPPGTTFVDYRRNVRGKRLEVTWDGAEFKEVPPP